MILINQQQTKKVYFYLTPIGNPTNYFFQFTSNDTGDITTIMVENNSTDPNFQSFTFSEGSGVTSSGGFNLIPGTYDYVAYQLVGSVSNILHIGLMSVLGGTGSNYIWKENPQTDYVYYNPYAPTPPGLTGS